MDDIGEDWRNEQITKEDLTPGTLEHPKEFGIWDIENQTWMGTTECAFTFSKRVVAQAMAQVLAIRIEVPETQMRVIPFTSANVRVEDINPTISFEQAWKKVAGEEC
jgi:hypothetical protein